ncbi:MAG: EAL domain-containing protein [Chloroflexi bacterium]|nr:EAL domain-containing protein [Chloroflexota bacterium]
MSAFFSVRAAARRLPPETAYKVGMILAATLVGGQALLWVLLRGDPSMRVALNDWASLVGSLSAFVAMTFAAYWSSRLDRRLGRSWTFFALAMFGWMLGDLLWLILELGYGLSPYPSIADFFYLIAYPLFLTGVLLFPRQPGIGEGLRWLWLDVLIIMLSAAGVFWNLSLSEAFRLPPSPAFLLASAAYPLGDLMLVLSITLILFQPRLPQWFAALSWMLAGQVLTALADILFSFSNLNLTFSSSLFFNLLFAAAPLLFMLSGLAQAVAAQRAVQETRTTPFQRYEGPLKLMRLVLPFLWLILAYILIHISERDWVTSNYLRQEAWISGILLLLVVREVVITFENDRLAAELRGLNDDLEKRVAERASSLTLTNYELRREMEERRRIEMMLREREEKLAHFALHDALTGLPNRSLLVDRLKQAIQRLSRRPEERYAVLFLDFDSFKVVNDSLGHLVGDQLLIQIGQRLTSLVRSSDTVARLGGDEFIVLLEGLHSESYVSATSQRVLDSFLEPFDLGGHAIYVTASIGVVISSPEYQSAVDILRDADLAMYAAKTSGKARFTLFSTEMRHRALNRLTLESELHHALDWNELALYYQPIYCLENGRLYGFEALIRWHHPARGLIGPSEFIPIAEMSGFVNSITHWLLHEACRQVSTWQSMLPPELGPLSLSVNLSPLCLRHPELLHWLEQSLNLHSVSPSQLNLEIVETALLDEVDLAKRVFSDMRRLGVKVSLDDFGIGYSSLSYLTQYPIDVLKIDRSFISRTTEAAEVASIVRAIIALARELKIAVVAEGVETQAQLDFVREAGCQYAQGNVLAPALSVDEAHALLVEHLRA